MIACKKIANLTDFSGTRVDVYVVFGADNVGTYAMEAQTAILKGFIDQPRIAQRNTPAVYSEISVDQIPSPNFTDIVLAALRRTPSGRGIIAVVELETEEGYPTLIIYGDGSAVINKEYSQSERHVPKFGAKGTIAHAAEMATTVVEIFPTTKSAQIWTHDANLRKIPSIIHALVESEGE